MAQKAVTEGEGIPRGRKRNWLRKGALALVVLLLLALALAWLQRKEIADSFIADTFAQNDIRASYTIDSIGPQRQVLSNIVIGDPAAPDLTIERLELGITPRFGLPDLNELVLVRPRIYGSFRDGQLSFGNLDSLIFTDEEGPVEFPDARLVIEDGRGLLDTDYGRIGLKIGGGGHLRGGFNAELAAVAEGLALPGCALATPTLYGRLSIDAERPHFVGPMRFASLDCPAQGVALAGGAVEMDVFAHRDLASFEGNYALAMEGSRFASARAENLSAEGRFTWEDGTFNALYSIAVSNLATPAASAAVIALEGRVRAIDSFGRIEVEGDISGSGLKPGAEFDAQLASAVAASEGTLAAPLLAKLRTNLVREMRGSTLAASFDARRIGDVTSLVVPEARLRGGSGGTLLALSRTQFTIPAEGLPRFSGNLATGGEGLPQISGRMEQVGNGALSLRLAMREYSAGDARLAVPQLTVLQGRDGRMALEGRALASGPLPGGFAQGLVLPIDGTLGADGVLALWNGCRDVRFDRLALANLTLGRQSLRLCPPSGRPILRYGSGGLQLAAGATSLDMQGELAQTPIRLRSGPVGFAYPGAMSARDLDIVLGPADNAQRFTISDLQANLSAQRIGGTFADVDVFLAAIPHDFLDAGGNWRYENAQLLLDGVDFRMRYRGEPELFEPLAAQGATLALADNRIAANAIMRHPASGRAVARVHAEHDLSSSSGKVDLFFDGLDFGDGFQPLDLSRLALGVVANVEGRVTGTGEIAWSAEAVTSRGSFTSASLDLAAAFGPVKGASGTVEFTDLLGLTTAPDQRIRLAAINPGIEVYDGEIGFQLEDGERLTLTGGSWPFMGGTLTMRPADINIGVAESRTYVMDIRGLEAARFIDQMDLSNLAASGVFDGTIPIVFDADGNGQLVAGELNSRAPGGNLSYVGELTYQDMGYFANYAFRTLRDLQYNRMEIDMNGPLTGELVTQVRFEGIRQGESAERNFVSRAIAGLPIELRINIRAPFYQLMTSLRAIYDPAALRDPRDLGLVRDDGVRLREAVDQETVDEQDARVAEDAERTLLESFENDEPDIQPPESEAMR